MDFHLGGGVVVDGYIWDFDGRLWRFHVGVHYKNFIISELQALNFPTCEGGTSFVICNYIFVLILALCACVTGNCWCKYDVCHSPTLDQALRITHSICVQMCFNCKGAIASITLLFNCVFMQILHNRSNANYHIY